MTPDWRAIEAEVPGLAIRSVAALGEGWTAHAYLVNGELVFKFPKRADDWIELDREIAFLAWARPTLPLPVADHLHQRRSSPGAPNGYAVYRHLPGRAVAGATLAHADRAALVANLAALLRVLHGLRPESSLALPHEDEREVAALYFRDAHEQLSPQLTIAERGRIDRLVHGYLDDPRNFPATACVIHADLSGEHILHENGAITGILDWGDVNLGDPDYDFHYLETDLGGEFVSELACDYGHSDVDRLLRKTYYFRVIDEVDTLVYGRGRALPGQEEAAWRRLRALLAQT